MLWPKLLMPSAIVSRKPGIQTVSEFVSQSGYSQRVQGSCAPFGLELTFQFEASQTQLQRVFKQFWYDVGGGADVSARAFRIPDEYCQIWDLLQDWPVDRRYLQTDELGRHWWVLVGRPDQSPDLCFFIDNQLTIRNVPMRAG